MVPVPIRHATCGEGEEYRSGREHRHHHANRPDIHIPLQ